MILSETTKMKAICPIAFPEKIKDKSVPMIAGEAAPHQEIFWHSQIFKNLYGLFLPLVKMKTIKPKKRITPA